VYDTGGEAQTVIAAVVAGGSHGFGNDSNHHSQTEHSNNHLFHNSFLS
jgi:hypothetical protein